MSKPSGGGDTALAASLLSPPPHGSWQKRCLSYPRGQVSAVCVEVQGRADGSGLQGQGAQLYL